MTAVDPALRLAVQRALLGAISPEIRLIKVRRDDDEITLTTIAAHELGEGVKDALSIAAAEVIADFPECRIRERLVISAGDLPREDALAHGWVYQRREAR